MIEMGRKAADEATKKRKLSKSGGPSPKKLKLVKGRESSSSKDSPGKKKPLSESNKPARKSETGKSPKKTPKNTPQKSPKKAEVVDISDSESSDDDVVLADLQPLKASPKKNDKTTPKKKEKNKKDKKRSEKEPKGKKESKKVLTSNSYCSVIVIKYIPCGTSIHITCCTCLKI